MSFSADKVPVLKGAFSQRRFSTSKEPSENGALASFLFRFHPNFITTTRQSSTGHVPAFGPDD
jgi:hypothetical protein